MSLPPVPYAYAQTRRCGWRRISIERRTRIYVPRVEAGSRNTLRGNRNRRNGGVARVGRVGGARSKVVDHPRPLPRSRRGSRRVVEAGGGRRDWTIMISCRDICHAPVYNALRTTTMTRGVACVDRLPEVTKSRPTD